MNFSLLDSLTQSFPNEKFTKRIDLANKIKDIKDPNSYTALCSLIYQYYEKYTDYTFDLENCNSLPPGCVSTTNGTEIHLDDFPDELCWILLKFYNILNSEKTTK